MEEKVKAFLELATQKKASDIFIIAGRPLSVKIDGKLCTLDGFEERLMPPETDEFIRIIYKLAHDRNIEPMLETGDDDFSMAIPGLSRFRVNTYRQRGSLAAVIRIIAFNLPDPQDLHIPPAVMEAADLTKGMVLITGPAGSGKSTTMACIIDKINHSREGHIITLEDPLEYLHRHDKCIVSQREICTDTANYLVSLRATLRQSPDVILLGEMRDHETIQTAMTAAETGHLILSSLHTTGAANTISRIMDVFEPSQQHQIAIQLSMVLQTVISQQLVPDVNGHNIPVFEIMRLTPAIRNMIRDNKIYQIDGVIASSSQANNPGYYISTVDGYENAVSYTGVLNLTTDKIDALIDGSTLPNADNSSYMGKLVDAFNWYILCVIDYKDAASLKVGGKITVEFTGTTAEPLSADVVKINDAADGRTSIILKCNLMNKKYAVLRKNPVKLIFNTYTGYQVNNKAVREINGQKGVYVLNGNIVKFKKINIVYSDSEYSICSVPDGESGYLKQYDEIIVEGTDLYDGKILD